LRNRNEKYKSLDLLGLLVLVELLGHVAEWLRRGLQILVFKHFYLSSHSKVPVKESIILKFILQVISWSIPGQFWGGSQTSLITHSQSQAPRVLHCSFVRLCLRPRVYVLVQAF